MKSLSCDVCGSRNLDFDYIVKDSVFKCKNCDAPLYDSEFSKNLQLKRAIDASIKRKDKKPIVFNTGDGVVNITIVYQENVDSHRIRDGIIVTIVGSIVGSIILYVANYAFTNYIMPLLIENGFIEQSPPAGTINVKSLLDSFREGLGQE